MVGENVVSFQCRQCGKPFTTQCSLRAHQHRNHSGRKFICYHCKYQTNFKHVLQKHIGAIHFTRKVEIPRHKCPLCNAFTASVRQAMLDHYSSGHNVNVNKTILEFDNDDDFCHWKRERERADSCQFVLSKGGRRTDQGELIRYFRCSRDGYSRIKRTGKRTPKKEGSVKTNFVCPCSIKVVQTPSGLCRIEYVPTHVGHTCDVGKLQLSQQERDDIAQKLAARMPVEAILDSLRESMSGGNISRSHLTTRKDLRNIMRRIHVPSRQRFQALEAKINRPVSAEACEIKPLSQQIHGYQDAYCFFGDANAQVEERNAPPLARTTSTSEPLLKQTPHRHIAGVNVKMKMVDKGTQVSLLPVVIKSSMIPINAGPDVRKLMDRVRELNSLTSSLKQQIVELKEKLETTSVIKIESEI